MDNKQQILRQLREADGYLSGQHLSGRLGISRTAVWKIIGRLKKEGYPIEAVTNKGYRLLSVEGRDLFNREEIENRLQTEWAGHPLVFLTETGSTNADIFRLSDEGYPSGTLAVAAQQTAGKGRRGRTWISPPDVNVYMSILLKPPISPENAPMLTLVMALAVYQACEALYSEENVQFGIKWPNDIVVSADGGPYKKICGILTEMRMEEKEIRDIVIGTGINANQTEFPEEIRETAGSLALALGHAVNRAELTAETWRFFEADFEAFCKTQSLEPLRAEYEAALVNRGRKVRVLDPQEPYEGTAMGITAGGELIVRPQDGSADREVSSGEVSVRGVMGYV
jgi:BirA family biotin operon repressor/biotin-[acetyl-CoA-carboxylase] ligase